MKLLNETGVNLSAYDNRWFKPGRGIVIRLLWYVTNCLFFINPLNGHSGIKIFLLRLFGAHVGKGVVIKPGVNIKYPWNLSIGDYTWIGERVWIDCLTGINISSNCCISQGAILLNGNHNYSKTTFDLVVNPIIIEDGVWIGARSMVTDGVTCFKNSVLAVNSVASSDLESNGIYRGNPAVKVRNRRITCKTLN